MESINVQLQYVESYMEINKRGGAEPLSPLQARASMDSHKRKKKKRNTLKEKKKKENWVIVPDGLGTNNPTDR